MQTEQLQYLTAEQLAEVLGVSRRTIERRVAARRLPFHRIGHNVRFDLKEVLEATRVKPKRF